MNTQVKNKFEYKEHYVAFLDVLGFREIVKNPNRVKDYYNFIRKFIVEEFPELNELLLDNYGIRLQPLIMSDAIVLSTPANSGTSSLPLLCYSICNLQMFLAGRNFWLRGGIAKGKMFFDGGFSFIAGPALTAAYLLEKDHAIYPRIVLHPTLLRNTDGTKSDLVFRTKDKRLEIPLLFNLAPDHLTSIRTDNSCPFLDFAGAFFRSHSDSIGKSFPILCENLKTSMHESPEGYSKHQWTRNYLINVLDNLKQSPKLLSEANYQKYTKMLAEI